MSTDLDTRLRALTELSPPAHGPLGASELHRRATHRQRRTVALRSLPAIIVVLALLAGAVALANRTTTTDIVVGPPDEAPGAAALDERDLQALDLASSAATLASEIEREMLLGATFSATGGTVGSEALGAQRTRTDRAVVAYRTAAADFGAAAPEVDDAVRQSMNRVDRLDVSRRAVDSFQASPLVLLDPFDNTSVALVDVQMRLAFAQDRGDLLRGLLTSGYAGGLATNEALLSAQLTVSIEAGFFGEWPNAGSGSSAPGLCGEDPAGAGDACMAYAEPLQSSQSRDQSSSNLLSVASGAEKVWFRDADAGSEHDRLVRSAFDDGIAINDLRGFVPGSVAIDPPTWRQRALDRLDRLTAFQQRVLASIRFPEPAATTPGGGSTPVTSTTVATIPMQPTTETTVPSPTTSVGNPAEEITTGRSSTERVTETPAPPTSSP